MVHSTKPHPDAKWDKDLMEWKLPGPEEYTAQGSNTPPKISKTDHLSLLGNQDTKYEYAGANAAILETFPNPMTSEGMNKIRLENTFDEFTSLCPKTGQPDFARIIVEYIPRDVCVESKSWKLFLTSFRETQEFHESCVELIHSALWEVLDPKYLYVQGQFTPRGGIAFWPEKERVADDG